MHILINPFLVSIQAGSEVRPNPSLPLLDELDSPSGVDLLLQAGSAEARCFEPLQGSPGFSSLRQILRAASDSLSSKEISFVLLYSKFSMA